MSSHLVAIAGGTASGKTTLTRHLLAIGGSSIVDVIELDGYYSCQQHRTMSERIKQNYDHPDAFEFSLLAEHLRMLRNGEPIEVPVYDFANHTRCINTTRRVEPRPIIIVEGILTLCAPSMQGAFDTRIFVEASEELRLARRTERDVRERGRTVENVLVQWKSTVQPMHSAYCEPTREHADKIVDGTTLSNDTFHSVWKFILDRSRSNSR